jgi:transposase
MSEPIKRIPYPSDLSDKEWEIIEPLIPTPQTNRRLSKDYEGLTEYSQAFVYAAMIPIMIRRLGRIKSLSK